MKDVEQHGNRFEVISEECDGVRVLSHNNNNGTGYSGVRGVPFWFFMKGDYQIIPVIEFPKELFEI